MFLRSMQKRLLNELTIGNDIVDLQEHEPPLHHRYIKRVFTAHEQSRFGTDMSRIWLNWSAKEAAYKAISRILPETVFSPIDFELISDELVLFKDQLLHHKFILNSRYAFSYCSSSKEIINSSRLTNWIKELPTQLCSSEHSTRIRDFVKNKLADFYGVSKTDLHIPLRSENNSVPSVMLSNQPVKAKLSFSHHGKFLACSFLDTSA